MSRVRSEATNREADMTWYLYIARCEDKSLYIGISEDPAKRINRHNTGKGSAWIEQHGPAIVVYKETHPTYKDVRRREAQIKRWSRIKKEKLINGSI